MDRDIKRLVSQRSIGGLKRTHTLADKSKPMPVLWTVKEGHSVISDLKLLSCVTLGDKFVIIIIIIIIIVIIIIIIIIIILFYFILFFLPFVSGTNGGMEADCQSFF